MQMLLGHGIENIKMEDYTEAGGEWMYTGEIKKQSFNCNKCGNKVKLTDKKKYICEVCGRVFKKKKRILHN